MMDKLQKFCVISLTQGGRHADNTIDIQEFMIMPVGAKNFKEGLRMCAEIYHSLKKLLKKEELSTAVGDEGGFAPNLPDAQAALAYIVRATEEAGYKAGTEVSLALDVAATELYDRSFKKYVFEGESKTKDYKVIRSSEELIDYYEGLIEQFPIVSIEDPLDEEDWDGWELLTTRFVCDKHKEIKKRNRKRSCQCNSHKSESDWNTDRGTGYGRDGAESRLQNDCITPFRGNSRYLDSRSCSSSRGRSD